MAMQFWEGYSNPAGTTKRGLAQLGGCWIPREVLPDPSQGWAVLHEGAADHCDGHSVTEQCSSIKKKKSTFGKSKHVFGGEKVSDLVVRV